MFSNLIAYQYFIDSTEAVEGLTHDALEPGSFAPCGPTQEKSIGWIPPRGEDHGSLVECVGGEYIARLAIETRTVPASALDKRVKAQAEHIEQLTGRKPGKKERREIREDAKLELLPQAFPKMSTHFVWGNPSNGLLVIEATSQGQADDVVTALVTAVAGLKVSMINTTTAPQAAMTAWLMVDDFDSSQEVPGPFTIGRECELRSTDEEKSIVKFTRHNLVNEEVRDHIRHGLLPTRLALNWQGRIDFVLTDALALKKVVLLDGALDLSAAEKVDAFDADVAIATGELQLLLVDLIDALGGYAQVAE